MVRVWDCCAVGAIPAVLILTIKIICPFRAVIYFLAPMHRYLFCAPAFALALATITTCLAPKAMAGDFTYITNNNAILITGYSGSGGTVTIPDTLDGFPVTSIQANVFAANAGITNVVIPAGVTNFGDGAFLNCPNLTRATVPGNVNYNSDLTGFYFFQVVFGQSPVASLTIAAGSPFITHDAFNSVASLTNVTIPSSVSSIQRNAFAICQGLTSVTIPDSVTDLQPVSFGRCTNLTSVTLGKGITTLEAVFLGCSSLGSITIPNTVTNIGGSAFRECLSLTNVVIPSGVTSIGASAFSGCKNLPAITIPNGVTIIGSSAFSGCWSLKEIVIPSGVTSIEPNTFVSCLSATNIVIPTTVTNIGTIAFYGCSSLRSVVIPSGVTTIAGSTFQYCGSLTNITVPSSVTNIGLSAFSDCANLRQISIPNTVTGIGASAFQNCSSLLNVVIPNGVASLEASVFQNCSSLLSVGIPAGLTNIGASAFQNCSSLPNVVIPDGVTSVDATAFGNCSSLTNVTLSGNFTFSFTGAFAPPVVIGVTISDTSTFIRDHAFELVTNLTSVTIPGSVTNTGSYAFYQCYGLTNLTLGYGVATIGDFSFAQCANLRNFTIPSSVRSIQQVAFYGCLGLTSVTIPDSVTNLDLRVFYLCTNLTSATLGKGITTLGRVFENCTSLGSIEIPNTVTNIGGNAFSVCRSLTHVVIPNSVTSIGNSAFSGCWSLNGIIIPSSVTTIGPGAFRLCRSLTGIYFAGNAPTPDNDVSVFEYGPASLIAYYLPGTTGWQAKFDGVPTMLWNPAATALSAAGGHFSFNITGPTNAAILVEACTNLADPVWVPLATKFLAGGQSQFDDPSWASYPRRFYRFSPSSVTVLLNTVLNADFSSPFVPNGVYFQYNPVTAADQPWSFVGYSGVANDLGAPGSSFAVSDVFTRQYAFLQLAGAATPGAFSQSVALNQAGSYSLFYRAAGRVPSGGSNGNLNYSVQILPDAGGGGTSVLSVTNSVTDSAPFTSKVHPFTIATPGKYTIKFTAVSGFGGSSDNTALITDVGISSP